MLFGEYHHTMDPQRRLSMPAKMREDLGNEVIIARSVRGNCLRFFSISAWKEYIEPIKKLPRSVSEQTYWYLYHDAIKDSFSSNGRVQLSEELLAAIGVNAEKEDERNLVLVGCGDFGEIWSEKAYSAREIDVDAIRRALEENGY